MQVTVEKVSNIERRLTIVVPPNQVQDAYNKQIEQFAKKANIKGFRPGKAPLSYIQQHYGNDARREAFNEVMQTALYTAMTEHQLKPVSTPRIEQKTSLIDQPLEFIATFEVLPDIQSVVFEVSNIDKPEVSVTDQDVERVIDQLTKQYTNWKLVDRSAQEKDRVVIDYYAIFEGHSEIDNTNKNFPIELGSNVMLPGFEAGLIGSKAGDEVKLNLTFPADFQIAERASKPVEFVVTVKQVFEATMPELNEDFIKKLGVKTGELNDLKAQIKQSLEFERDRLITEKLKEQVFNRLLDQNPIEVPASLIAREAHAIHDEIYQNQPHDHHTHSAEETAAFNDIAKKRVTLGLLLAEYAKQTNLTVDNERVNKRIQEIASAYEHPADVVAWLSSKERRGGVEAQVLEDQVMDKLMEGVPVTTKVMSYAELKGIQL